MRDYIHNHVGENRETSAEKFHSTADAKEIRRSGNGQHALLEPLHHARLHENFEGIVFWHHCVCGHVAQRHFVYHVQGHEDQHGQDTKRGHRDWPLAHSALYHALRVLDREKTLQQSRARGKHVRCRARDLLPIRDLCVQCQLVNCAHLRICQSESSRRRARILLQLYYQVNSRLFKLIGYL